MNLQLTHDDLDGVVAAKAFRKHVDEVAFIGYSTKVETIQMYCRIYKPELLVLTDINIRSHEAHILDGVDAKVVFIDHHKDCGVEPSATCTVIHNDSGDYCGADLAYLTVERSTDDEWCKLAHDYDLWIKDIPESEHLADLVRLLGPEKMFQYVHFDPYTLLKKPMFKRALEEASKLTEASRELAEQTRLDLTVNVPSVDEDVPLCVCAIKGNSSRVGHDMCEQEKGMLIVMLDLTQPNAISLRTERDDLDLSLIAPRIHKDGGGHPKAAGTQLPLEAILPELQAHIVKVLESGE